MDKIYDLAVFPKKNNEAELNEFAKIGEKLNLAGLCFCFEAENIKEAEKAKALVEKAKKKTELELFFGIILCEGKKGKLIQKAGMFRNMADIIAAKALTPESQRAICESKSIDLLIRNYTLDPNLGKDGYFDKIMADLCRKNNVANTILFSDLISLYRTKRANYLNFVKNDLKIFRKAKSPLVVVSGAKHPMELRGVYSLLSVVKIFENDNEFRKIIGENSINMIGKIKNKKSRNYIRDGIKLKNKTYK
ncbi:MAG: hypothetical protein DRN66_00545 [Candidatus Nanohalarchaeota archaeon]|nr:MAG: hypothetical protein DRN66_00545 [Candidatus Nanohaloarchaeota archaeon]